MEIRKAFVLFSFQRVEEALKADSGLLKRKNGWEKHRCVVLVCREVEFSIWGEEFSWGRVGGEEEVNIEWLHYFFLTLSFAGGGEATQTQAPLISLRLHGFWQCCCLAQQPKSACPGIPAL